MSLSHLSRYIHTTILTRYNTKKKSRLSYKITVVSVVCIIILLNII